MGLQLPGDRDLPNPDAMVQSIIDGESAAPIAPVRSLRRRVLAISAVAACGALVLGAIGVLALPRAINDSAPPPVASAPSQTPTAAQPSPIPSEAPTTPVPSTSASASPDASLSAPSAARTPNPSAEELRDIWFPGSGIDPTYINQVAGETFDVSTGVGGGSGADRLPGDLTMEPRNAVNLTCAATTLAAGEPAPNGISMPCEVIKDGGPTSVEFRIFFTMPDGEQLVMIDWYELNLEQELNTTKLQDEFFYGHGGEADDQEVAYQRGTEITVGESVHATTPLPFELVLETRNAKNMTCQKSTTLPVGWNEQGEKRFLGVPCTVTVDNAEPSVEYRVYFQNEFGDQAVMNDWFTKRLREQQ